MMKLCPNGSAAWVCEFHLHCGREHLCQHKKCKELTERRRVDSIKECEGFEPKKRYVKYAKRVLGFVDKE